MKVLNYRLMLLIVAVSFFAAFPLAIHAIEYNPFPVYEITCTGVNVIQVGSLTWTRDTTGTGIEILRYEVSDGDGTILFLADDTRSVGSNTTTGLFAYTSAPDYNPIRLRIYSPAGNGLPEEVYIDQTGACDSLLTIAVPVDPIVPVDRCDVIPANAVMGDLPFDTRAFYEPGKISTVTVNAGTYYVLGTDESGEYYKIQLSCINQLWLPAGSLQPSFQAPWNGQSLPTDVVS